MQLKVIFRNLFRDKLNSLVILVSLAIGIACFNLTSLFVYRELTTDSFQRDKDRIYTLTCDDPFRPGQKIDYVLKDGPEFMKEHFPQIEDYCRLRRDMPQKICINHNDYFNNINIIEASPNFFAFYSYQLINGNTGNVLESKENMVISEEFALKYFGKTDPIGQMVELTNNSTEKYIVTGVFKKPIQNSLFNFDMVHSLGNTDSRCQIKLAEGASKKETEKQLLEKRQDIPVLSAGTPGLYHIESMADTYFGTGGSSFFDTQRSKTDLLVAGSVGIIIMIIALFNTLGLLNNKLMLRAKETAIRRINGSTHNNMFGLFMTESLILIASAFVLATLLLFWFLSFFNQMLNTHIQPDYIFNLQPVILFLTTFMLVILVMGVFIFIRLPKVVNVESIKTDKYHQGRIRQFPVFNVIQLAASVILIVISITIIKQMNFIASKPIGMNRDVYVVNLPYQYKDKSTAFKDELKTNPFVTQVSVSNFIPLTGGWMILLNYNSNGIEQQYTPSGFSGDENISKILGLKVIAGNNFSPSITANKGKCLINQSFAKLFPDQDLIGKKVPGMTDEEVIGVVEDFNFHGLKKKIEPAYLLSEEGGSTILVKPEKGMDKQVREKIAQVWKDVIPDFPFDCSTIGEIFEKEHKENENFIRFITTCALISIVLSMIGMFAISVQTSRGYIKEVGIRKVNGATVIEIIGLLNKDFVLWVSAALIIAIPLACYFASKWLEGYVYKTSLSWWIFALSGLIALGIALLTVSWQSWRAATRNPVEALRYE